MQDGHHRGREEDAATIERVYANLAAAAGAREPHAGG